MTALHAGGPRDALRLLDRLPVPLCVALVVVVLGWSGGSMADPDVWWHVRTGRLILDGLSVPHTDPWSYTSASGNWVPTAWLSDVLFALVWKLGGYDGVRMLRVALAIAVISAIWVVAQRSSNSTRVAAGGAALALFTLAPFLRERPQVISYLFVAWLALRLQRVLEGQPPPLVLTTLIAYLWANLHGLWILLPVAVLGAGVLAWADDPSRVPLAARCTLIAGLAWGVAALTPAGPRVAIWPIVVQRVAAPITEWHSTVPLSRLGVPFLVIIFAILARWARSTEAVPVSRITMLIAVTIFGLMAYRNVAPAAILLLPELVRRGNPQHAARTAPNVPRAGLAALVVGAALALAHLATSPAASATQPVRIAEELAGRPGPIRVLNAYDVGGLLTGTASPPAQVAIDGRTDMWSPRFVRDYIEMLAAVGSWRTTIASLKPDVAVLDKDSELALLLQRERGWRVTLVDGGWALLEPP